MTKEEIIEKLRDDDHYYGEFGQQYLSNSNIKTLDDNPLSLREPIKKTSALLIGGYFHTVILEPNKVDKYKIIESSSRNTKHYKEMSDGELCLLQQEVDRIELMKEKIELNDACNFLMKGFNVEYEVPNIVELFGNMWKGKADIINHDEKLIVDLKTTSNINKFKSSAYKYNYDSQAYIYSKLFGYEFCFIVIDKNTLQIGIFDCSPEFYRSGADKVQQASATYDLFYKDDNFDPTQYFISKTL
tara:strand:+ start:325 stop:1056 length:732 start_codon:yes stop_codon:yes gene_type:complete